MAWRRKNTERIEHTHEYTSQNITEKKTQVGGLPLERVVDH